MSLGLARDSMLNLSKLAHDDDDDQNNTDKYVKKSASFTREHMPHDNNITSKGTEDDFLFLDDMEQETKDHVENDNTAVAAAMEDDLFSVESEDSKTQNTTTTNDTGAYAGFAYDYSEYGDYYSDPYAPTSFMDTPKKNNRQNIFCCIFAPWFSKKNDDDDDTDEQSDGKPEQNKGNIAKAKQQTQPQTIKKGKDPSATFEEEKKCHQDELGGDDDTDDGALSDTDAYGEKMTDKDRKALLARLRLSDPSPPPIPSPDDEATTATPSSILDKVKSPPPPVFRGAGAHSHTTSVDQQSKSDAEASPYSSEITPPAPKVKGILKKTKSVFSSTENLEKNKNNTKDVSNSRRALFPKYESRNDSPTSPVNANREAVVNNVQFSPMARVITIHTHHNMSFAEKSRVWFQRSDYDEFKKTGRIVAKAMLEGGSEIWLTTSNAWGKRTNQQQSKGENVDSDYDRALQKYTNKSAFGGSSPPSKQEPGETPTEQQDDFGNKWWCKFGHSRRGLEHIASMEEGQQRQRNVNAAIRAVMDEQRRQRATHTRDSRKLATIAYNYTSWARDLALAAGKADAEAVQTNFKNDAKGRIHHLTESLRDKSTTCSIASNDLATGKWHGIIGASSSNKLISSERLDANTASTMKYKQQQQKMLQMQMKTNQQKQQTTTAPSSPNRQGNDPSISLNVSGGVTEEAIHDPDFSHEHIAKKAAGYGIGDDSKDMSAVLTGMGAAGVTAAS